MNWGEVDPYNLVTVEQYLADMYHVMTDKSLRKKVHKFLPFLFQAVDKDNSGEISIEEFKLFFNCLGLTDQDAEMSFNAIDKNSDGMLSIKEFVKLGRAFFLTENPKHVSRNFWGPLVSAHWALRIRFKLTINLLILTSQWKLNTFNIASFYNFALIKSW